MSRSCVSKVKIALSPIREFYLLQKEKYKPTLLSFEKLVGNIGLPKSVGLPICQDFTKMEWIGILPAIHRLVVCEVGQGLVYL